MPQACPTNPAPLASAPCMACQRYCASEHIHTTKAAPPDNSTNTRLGLPHDAHTLTSQCPSPTTPQPVPGPPAGPPCSHTPPSGRSAAACGTLPRVRGEAGGRWRSTGRTGRLRGPAAGRGLQVTFTGTRRGGAVESVWERYGLLQCHCGAAAAVTSCYALCFEVQTVHTALCEVLLLATVPLPALPQPHPPNSCNHGSRRHCCAGVAGRSRCQGPLPWQPT
jgi:hypothetical protein